MLYDKEDMTDVDDRLTDLLEDLATDAQYALDHPGSPDASENLHKAMQAVKRFCQPTPLERRETYTADGTKTILVYRGFDLVEQIVISDG